MSIQLSKFIIDDDSFQRMQSLISGEDKGWLEGMTYAEFLEWNINCINELSDEDDAWLTGLCKRLKRNRIILQDMESCCQFNADSFYFDCDKNIVIVNPR